jgi:RNA ligase (TIGR02306 family)
MTDKLAYVGKVISLDSIEGADRIESATVVCGEGGKWCGIVQKGIHSKGGLCVVYLPDSIILESEELSFMEKFNWRVRMCRFRGAKSEVLITEMHFGWIDIVGTDVTQRLGVTKYEKILPAHLNGVALGDFPGFIPKTDEPNWQREPSLVKAMKGQPFYVTMKIDGSSTTAFKYNGEFGLCSRNLQLKESDSNGYWSMAKKYNLPENLMESIAIQWETAGPGIQGNPMQLKEISAFVFSGYNIEERRYLDLHELVYLCIKLGMPMAEILRMGSNFNYRDIGSLGDTWYSDGIPCEGVVVRTQNNIGDTGRPISFKVINLNYEDGRKIA